MKLGSKDISKVYLGSKEISKVYLGSKEIFTSEIVPNGSPSELVATILSDTSIKLDWTIGSTNQDGHRIYYKQEGGSYSALGIVTGTTATYTVTDLTAATEYYFYVVAYKGSKESSASNVVNGTTFLPSYSDLSVWLASRSELNIIDSISADNAQILPVCGKTNGTDSYIKAPTATKDLSFTEITIEAYVMFKASGSINIFGRNLTGNANGDIMLYLKQVDSTHRYISFLNYSTSYEVVSNININNSLNTLYHIIGTQSVSGGMKLYVNGVDKGSSSYNAILASATEPFVAGAWLSSTVPSGFANMEIYSTRLYNVCLTAEELTARWNLQDVTRGLVLSWDFMGDIGSSTEHDRSGNDNHGTWIGTSPYYTYSQYGCKDNLNNGYKRYFKLGYSPICLPKLIGSTNYPTSIVIPAGYIEQDEIIGSSTKHNLAGSKIRLPNKTVFDRSNTTTNNSFSRSASSYDSSNVTDWHIWESSNWNIITSYLNDGYQGIMFPKNTWHEGLDGVNRSISLDELLLYNTNKTGSQLTNILHYTGNE